MDRRHQLQTMLEILLGSRNVYFQPPSNVKLNYPCIVYKRDSIRTNFADDIPYTYKIRYAVTVIDKNPDNSLISAMVELPMCIHNRHFIADNLNHDVFTLYF